MSSEMRLLVVNDNPVYTLDGQWYSDRQWPLVGLQLIRAAGHGTLFSPIVRLSSPAPSSLTKLDVDGATLVDSGFFGGTRGELQARLFRARRWRTACLAAATAHDFVLCRVPSSHIRYVTDACATTHRPLGLIVAGHRIKQSVGIDEVPRILRTAARRYLVHQNKQQLRVARQAVIVFVNGQELLNEWNHAGNVVLWQDGHITSEMYYERCDTCTGTVTRLLRVCHLSKPRGVEVLLAAFRMLLHDHPNLLLDIVGEGSDPAYVKKLKTIASNISDGSRVTFHGLCNKQRTIQIMRSADVQVISSHADGVPRVYLEGAANCLPLVATTVGGIPSFVRNEINGLLVPPGDPLSMAKAVHRLLTDSSLRQRLIASAYQESLMWEQTRTQQRMIDLIRDRLALLSPRSDTIKNTSHDTRECSHSFSQ
jgi:glycosyltransferase involved in cell wall biosynthesis